MRGTFHPTPETVAVRQVLQCLGYDHLCARDNKHLRHHVCVALLALEAEYCLLLLVAVCFPAYGVRGSLHPTPETVAVRQVLQYLGYSSMIVRGSTVHLR